MPGLQMLLHLNNRVFPMRNKYFWLPLFMLFMMWLPDISLAQGLPMVTVNSGKGGQQYSLTLQLLDMDDKRMHIFHAMYHGKDGHLLATGEQMLVHVDMAQGRAAPMPEDVYQRVAAVHRAHSALPRPAQAGQPLGIRRKPQN